MTNESKDRAALRALLELNNSDNRVAARAALAQPDPVQDLQREIGECSGALQTQERVAAANLQHAIALADALRACTMAIADELAAAGPDEVKQHPVLSAHEKAMKKGRAALAAFMSKPHHVGTTDTSDAGIDAMFAALTGRDPGDPDPAPTDSIEQICFVAESVAHMKGLERDILPHTERVREWLKEQG